jgi:hypothetical protein
MPCCMSDHFNSNCNSHNPQHSSILKYWNITQHVTSLSVIWRHCKHIVIAITIYDSLMHCRISMKPCPESINEKKKIVLIMNEVDVGGFFLIYSAVINWQVRNKTNFHSHLRETMHGQFVHKCYQVGKVFLSNSGLEWTTFTRVQLGVLYNIV